MIYLVEINALSASDPTFQRIPGRILNNARQHPTPLIAPRVRCLNWLLLSGAACTSKGPRTIRVAQSGAADVIGSDNVALQKAANLLRAGDTLSIGEGVYTMNNSLLIPSNVTVRGVHGKTICARARGSKARSPRTVTMARPACA